MVSGLFLLEIGVAASDVAGALFGVNERLTELENKGYTSEQAVQMVNFELGYALTLAGITGVFSGGSVTLGGPITTLAMGYLTTSVTFPIYREAAQIISESVVDNGQDFNQKEFSIDLLGSTSFKFNFSELFNKASTTGAAVQDPLILDIDGDGLETTTLTQGVYFDHNQNGFAELSAWVGLDDAVVFTDLNSDGVVNNGSEIITSFAQLATYDTNSDNKIDTNDTQFAGLKILKGDGTLLSLPEAEIKAIITNKTYLFKLVA